MGLGYEFPGKNSNRTFFILIDLFSACFLFRNIRSAENGETVTATRASGLPRMSAGIWSPKSHGAQRCVTRLLVGCQGDVH